MVGRITTRYSGRFYYSGRDYIRESAGILQVMDSNRSRQVDFDRVAELVRILIGQ